MWWMAHKLASVKATHTFILFIKQHFILYMYGIVTHN